MPWSRKQFANPKIIELKENMFLCHSFKHLIGMLILHSHTLRPLKKCNAFFNCATPVNGEEKETGVERETQWKAWWRACNNQRRKGVRDPTEGSVDLKFGFEISWFEIHVSKKSGFAIVWNKSGRKLEAGGMYFLGTCTTPVLSLKDFKSLLLNNHYKSIKLHSQYENNFLK